MRREKDCTTVSGHSSPPHSRSPVRRLRHTISCPSGQEIRSTQRAYSSPSRWSASPIIAPTISKGFPIPCDLRLPRESASVRSARVLRFGGRCAADLPNASGSDWPVSGPTAATIATHDSGVFDAPTKALGRYFSACNAVLPRESCRLAEFVRAPPARPEGLRHRLLIAKRLNGIDARGPSRGNETRRQCYRA